MPFAFFRIYRSVLALSTVVSNPVLSNKTEAELSAEVLSEPVFELLPLQENRRIEDTAIPKPVINIFLFNFIFCVFYFLNLFARCNSAYCFALLKSRFNGLQTHKIRDYFKIKAPRRVYVVKAGHQRNSCILLKFYLF